MHIPLLIFASATPLLCAVSFVIYIIICGDSQSAADDSELGSLEEPLLKNTITNLSSNRKYDRKAWLDEPL